MKSLLTTLVLLFTFASCQKEYTADIVDGVAGTSGSFKARINSVEWNADKAAVAAFSTAGNGLPRLLNISGISNDKKMLTITLTDSGVHKYILSDNSMHAAAFIDSSLANTFAFTSNQGPENKTAGTVEITSINTAAKTISGTFSFKVYRMMDSTERDITQGSFTNIRYNDGAILPPSSTTDTFKVKINDTTFTPYGISATAIPFNNTIMVQGFDSLAVKGIGITFPANIVAGNYSFDSFSDYIGLYNTGVVSLASDTGTLKILEHNTATKRIRGNFNFKATNLLNPAISASLTAGYFSVKY